MCLLSFKIVCKTSSKNKERKDGKDGCNFVLVFIFIHVYSNKYKIYSLLDKIEEMEQGGNNLTCSQFIIKVRTIILSS